MRIKHPALLRLTGMFGAWILRFWTCSQRVRYSISDPLMDPRRRHRPCIYVCWHECLLMPVGLFAQRRFAVLASRNRDAEWLSQIMHWLGSRVVRGSTSRGAVRATREMLRNASEMSLATAPDGPHGPRRRVQPGVIYLASRTGLPIAPFGFGYRRPWRARSWDRFVLPRPFDVASCVAGQLIWVRPEAGADEREQYRALLQKELERVQLEADHMVNGAARP